MRVPREGSCRAETKLCAGRSQVTLLAMASHPCLVPVRRLFRPFRSMHFGDVSETNGREAPRQSWSAHARAFLKSTHGQLK